MTLWNDTAAPVDTDPTRRWGTGDDGPFAVNRPPAPAAPPFPPPPAGPPTGPPTPPPLPPQAPSPPPTRGGGARVVLAALAITGLVGAGYAGRGLVDDPVAEPRSVTATGAAVTNDVDATPRLDGSAEEPVKAVARTLGPSIVVIQPPQGLGSGVVYDSSGLIMTNAHVVGNAKTVKVTLDDGRSLDGEVLGADAVSDVAVVRVEADGALPAARLAETPPEVGDLAVALGSPFGFDQTITSGVVSAVNRPVENGNGGVVDMLQTDAAINPGNSGGALANRHAEVIGINSMIYSESGGNQGIGFAIPIDKAKSIADRIVSGGSLDKAYLGVTSQPSDDGRAGAEIREVTRQSAAEQAGLRAGDLVVEADGRSIKDPTDLAGAIAANSPGDTITVKALRDGREVAVEVTLGTSPAGSDGGTPGSRGQIPRVPRIPNR